MADVATAQARIAEIEAILAAGVSSESINGRSVAYDLKALEAERDRLSRVVAASTHSQFRRVVFRNGS